MFKINRDVSYLINSEIIEYDIKSANISICREYELLPNEIIDKIEQLPKQKRVEAIGKLMRKDRDFAKTLECKFNDVVNEFIKQNNLDDDSILSIKRDAVFVFNKEIHNTNMGKHITFLKKNNYHAYLFINNMEIYFKRNDSEDIKGMNDSLIPLHKNGILFLLRDLINNCEKTNMDKKSLNEYMSYIVNAYKQKKLLYECYREFNSSSKFLIHIDGRSLELDMIDDEYMQYLDISYNYINIILNLYRILC